MTIRVNLEPMSPQGLLKILRINGGEFFCGHRNDSQFVV